MIDVKKLITGFLILATAAGASGIILSFINIGGSMSPSIPAANQITIANTQVPTSNNIFLSNQRTNTTPVVLPSSTESYPSSSNPNNLTDVLASSFMNQIVMNNPNGPTSDASGKKIIAPPDANVIAGDITNSTTTQNLSTPNWDIEAGSQPINIIPSTPLAISQYSTKTNSILSGSFNSQLQTILSNADNGTDATQLQYIKLQVENALNKTISLPTPTSLVNYQKSLIKVLVYEKNMLLLTDANQEDPLKSSLIFQAEDQKFSLVLQDFQTQAQNIANKNVSIQQTDSTPPGGIFALVDNIFGIKTAHAQWSVFDPATWSLIEGNEFTTIASQVKSIVKNTLLQILKNTLISIIQQKVLTWVQGAGAPRFITDWAQTFINAYQQTALAYIDNKMSCGIYSGFLPQIQSTLGAYYMPDNNACANEFQAALGANTFQQFMGNFNNGGWLAYGVTMSPAGNYYGGAFFNAQLVDSNAQVAQTASKAQSTAGGGFKGDQACDDGSDPNNGEHTVCENPDGADYTITGSETCGPGDTPVVYANQGVCSDGTQPIYTTPSAVTGFAVNSALDATPKQIAAANDIAGLINSVAGSLLNSLATTAISAAGQIVNNTLQSTNPSNLSGGGTAPAPQPLACAPLTQTIPAQSSGPGGNTSPTSTVFYPVTISASGGINTTGTPPTYINPTYSWASSDGVTANGPSFTDTYTTSGTYTITLTDAYPSDSSATCYVIVQ